MTSFQTSIEHVSQVGYNRFPKFVIVLSVFVYLLIFSSVPFLSPVMAVKQQRQLQSFNELKFTSLRQKLESDALALANEVGRLYQSRCEAAFDDCSQGHYHECVSELPNPTCTNGGQYRRDSCNGSNQYSHCSGLFDFTASTIV